MSLAINTSAAHVRLLVFMAKKSRQQFSDQIGFGWPISSVLP
jgi:hypothetical protein